MLQKIKPVLSKIPAYVIASFLFAGGVLKVSGLHPMQSHFQEIGLSEYVPLFGAMEALFALLFVLPFSRRAALLLLTGYFGGAMAVELPHNMIMAPALVLALIYVAAFIRDPAYFRPNTMVQRFRYS